MLKRMILIKERETPHVLYTPYMEAEIDPDTDQPTGKKVVWSTDDSYEFEEKLEELLAIYPSHKIWAIAEVPWDVNVAVGW